MPLSVEKFDQYFQAIYEVCSVLIQELIACKTMRCGFCLNIEAALHRTSIKKGVRKNFAKLTGKHQRQGLFFQVSFSTLLKK